MGEIRYVTLLHCALSLAAQFVGLCLCVFVGLLPR